MANYEYGNAPKLPTISNFGIKEKRNVAVDKFESWLDKVLKDRGIKLQYSNNGSSALGMGLTTIAFDISYLGHSAVLKISENPDDYQKAIDIFDMRKSLGEGKKHIMKIYDYFEEDFGAKHFYFLIVEKLKPLNTHLKPMFNYLSLYSPDYKKELKLRNFTISKYEAIIFKMINIPEIRNICKGNIEGFTKHLANATFDIFQTSINDRSSLFDKNELIMKKINQISKIYLDVNNIGYDYYIQYIFKAITDRIPNIIGFPQDHEKKHSIEYSEDLPEFKSLIKTLNKLHNKNINWADLHGANIMERDDGTLVISDYGYFTFR